MNIIDNNDKNKEYKSNVNKKPFLKKNAGILSSNA